MDYYHAPPAGEAQDNNQVGRRLRRERKRLGMTQKEFAHFIGISTSYLGALERGERSFSAALLLRLHECLSLSYDYLMEGTRLDSALLSQYLRESSDPIERRISVMLATCSGDETEGCYHLIRTYLQHKRGIGRPAASVV